jgi:hypothetical protein
MRPYPLFALLTAILGSPSMAQDGPTAMARSYKVGDAGLYSFEMVVTYSGAEIPGSGAVERTVKEIKPNGDVIFTYTDKGATYVLNGEAGSVPAEPPMTVTTDKRGKVLSVKRESGTAGMMPESIMKLLAMLSQCVLPEKPVKPGDTWTTQFDNPTLKNGKFAVKSTFVGPDKLEDQNYLKVRETVSDLLLDIAEPGSSGLSAQTLFWIVPETGRVARLETKVKNLPIPALGTADLTMKATVKPLAPKAEAR